MGPLSKVKQCQAWSILLWIANGFAEFRTCTFDTVQNTSWTTLINCKIFK